MEGSIDIKLLLSLGAMLVSVVSASVIVKQKLASVIEQLNDLKKDYESRLRSLDQRTDKQENLIDLNSQKTEVLSSILSPSKLESQHREIERINIMTHSNSDRLNRLEKMHNGTHPPVKDKVG
jgi:phosphoglycerate-specific signal transduction histidine kinase